MLEAVIRSTPAAIAVLDLEGRVTMWNPAAERIFGWTNLEAVTFSVGVAVFPQDGQTPDNLLRAADQALYRAKSAGRDRVVAAQDNSPSPHAGASFIE